MGIKQHKNIVLYNSLEELPIWKFDKIMKGDLRFLSKKEDVSSVEINDDFHKIWEELYNEYAVITQNNTSIQLYLILGELNYLNTKLKIVPELVNLILLDKELEIVNNAKKELKLWGFSINENNRLIDEVKIISLALENSKNKIKRKEDEYKEIIKEKEKGLSLIQQRVKLKRILGIEINLKKESVLDWLAYWDEVKELTNQNKKQKEYV